MRITTWTCAISAIVVLALSRNAGAQTPWQGDTGVVRSVGDIMASDASAAPSLIARNRPKLVLGDSEAGEGFVLSAAFLPKTPIHPFSPQAIGTNWLAVQISEAPFLPPDSMGAAGLNQFLVVVNGRVKVFDKQGNVGALNTTTNNFFSSVLPGGSQGTSDPRVRFDRLSNRWFVSCITIDVPNRVLIAVSSDMSGGQTVGATTDFTFFFFQQDLVGTTPNSDTGGFADYDTLGIDANALYIGGNIFDSSLTSYVGATGWVVRKSSILSGGPIVVTAFRQIADNNASGLYTPQGVDNDDPAATEGYFIGVDGSNLSLLRMRRVSTPGTTPTISGNLNVGIPLTSDAVSIPVLGSTQPLDVVNRRLMMAHVTNGSLWTTHAILVDGTGAATNPGDPAARTGCRWYQIGNVTTTPVLSQSGTAFDPTASQQHYWIPSLAVSGQGHMALGCTVASPNLQASIGVAGRLANDPPGTTQALTLAVAGTANYNPKSGFPAKVQNPQRWGDYSYTSVDPTDNMTMWTVQEYCNASNSWAVQVIRLAAPPPATPTSSSPSTVSQGTNSVQVVITGTSTAGSGFYDPAASFPNHLTASVTGGVTVNSVTFTDATHVTLDLKIPLAATLGLQDITLTNPDGQSVVFTGGVTVTPSVHPTVLSVNSSATDGTYGVGAILPITVTFSAAVNVTGTPQLTLETGAVNEVVNFISGSGTATLSFGYAVVAGDTSPDLDYVSTNSLALNGGTIKSAGLVDADLTLPVPGTVGSLGGNKALVIDTQAPDTTITANPPALTNVTSATFVFSSSDPVGATFEVSLDGAGFVSNGASTTITYTSLSEGAHTFKVRAADTASPKNVDSTPATFSWTVDTTPPNTQITGQPPDPDTNLTPTFTYTSTEANSTFEYSVDGGAWTSTGTTGSVTLPSQFGGSHTFQVRATDPAGNVDPTPAQYTWSIPNGPPAPTPPSGHKKKGCGLVGLDAVALAALLAVVRRARRGGLR